MRFPVVGHLVGVAVALALISSACSQDTETRTAVRNLESRVENLERRLQAMDSSPAAPRTTRQGSASSGDGATPLLPPQQVDEHARVQRPDVRVPRLSVVDVQARATEQNTSWWRMAWRLTVTNSSDTPVAFRAEIQFVDSGGFVVDTDTKFGMTIAAGAREVYTGADLVTAAVAPNVAGVKALLTEN